MVLTIFSGGCGVRGRPQPPVEPPELGQGKPIFQRSPQTPLWGTIGSGVAERKVEKAAEKAPGETPDIKASGATLPETPNKTKNPRKEREQRQ